LIGDNQGSGLAEASPDPTGNLIGGATTGLIDPLLEPLELNRGHYLHILRESSPAVDAGDVNFQGPPFFDQRGVDRVFGSRVDIGAFEYTNLADGDFNGDVLYDCSDIDALTLAIVSQSDDLAFDLTNDQVVDHDDLNQWLINAGGVNLPSGNPYLPGDGNLDGQVDVSDFAFFNANKFTATGEWCSGDFNADGVTDIGDFNVWNSHKFQSSARPEDDRMIVELPVISAEDAGRGVLARIYSPDVSSTATRNVAPDFALEWTRRRSRIPTRTVGAIFDQVFADEDDIESVKTESWL